ncbi:ester cyclase [Nocardia sp. NPDC060256]|uniref:ester cyclase n=1 Tax=unclassified Nocardia TaxID=2637762 RepID=UPI0036623F93
MSSMTDLREANKVVAREILAAWNERGESYIPRHLVSEQFIRYFPHPVGFAAYNGKGEPSDPVLPKSAFPNQHFTEQMMIADDQNVFLAWDLTATHRGEFYGLEPTNKDILVYGSDVFRIADGKIVQHWDYYPKARINALAQLDGLGPDIQRKIMDDGYLRRNRVTGKVFI